MTRGHPISVSSAAGFDAGLPVNATRLAARLVCTVAAFAAIADGARADESGVSFWQPGIYDSLAATPNQPGWSLSTVAYHGGGIMGGAGTISSSWLYFEVAHVLRAALHLAPRQNPAHVRVVTLAENLTLTPAKNTTKHNLVAQFCCAK